ncbi:MAG: sugar phosphate nucleotidyltransferase, partial [Pseudomonadota bacterium]
MGERPTSGIVLAAGLGTRMRPLTDDRPKALVSVAGHTLLDHAILRLVRAGVTRVVVNVHYMADMVEAHLAGETRAVLQGLGEEPVEIVISDEREALLETGGGVKAALPLLGD